MQRVSVAKKVLLSCPDCNGEIPCLCWKYINLDESGMWDVIKNGVNFFSCKKCGFSGAVPLYYAVYSISRDFCFVCIPSGMFPGGRNCPSLEKISNEITSGKFSFKLKDSFYSPLDLLDSILMIYDGLDYKKGLFYKKNPPKSLLLQAAEKTKDFAYNPQLTKYLGVHSDMDGVSRGALFENGKFRFLIPVGELC